MSVMQAILDRASAFLPALATIKVADADVRVGLRPFAFGGLPFVGAVPGVPGLYVAAGHEGSGLTLGPATAELITSLILGGNGGKHSQISGS